MTKFTFAPLREADLPMLLEWLNRPHSEGVVGPRAHARGRAREVPATHCRRGCGASVYRVPGRRADRLHPVVRAWIVEGWYPDHPGPGVWGIDQFLADGGRLGQGLGTAIVSQFVERLFRDPEVTEVRLDPHPDNHRAIRCYEKAGFVRGGEILTPDGRALLMRITR